MTPYIKILLVFGATWFLLRMLDALWPPDNPVFNAALSLATCIGVLANMLLKHR